MARRGFFAELQYQSRLAEKQRERAGREAARENAASIRRLEQARREAERTLIQLSRAAAAERKRLEKASREAQIAAREAEVEAKNAELEQIYEEIDSLLTSTLGVDDYVDLNSLRVHVVHPPFSRGDLEVSLPQPVLIPDPAEPVLTLPNPPTGLASFFGKKKHAQAVEATQRAHDVAMVAWRQAVRDAQALRKKAGETYARDEASRLESLKSERERYEKDCAARIAEADECNKKLDELIANLGYGTADAVQEYVSIVLSNSVYADHFQVTHEFEFEPSTSELSLRTLVPGPGEIPEVRTYKYAKASDEIVSTSLSQKECRDQYASAIHKVALRSFHEVFEADRRGLIKTISLEVGTNTIDPATGQPTYVPFVIAAAERESFITFDLSAVVPALTLGRLGAAVSKNPYNLVAAERTGVRRS